MDFIVGNSARTGVVNVGGTFTRSNMQPAFMFTPRRHIVLAPIEHGGGPAAY